MTTEELKRLKSTELEILLDFDRYCKEHNLKYYLIGGALLGSSRYGGFIPWDDDIDVGMPREDYEQLKKIWRDDKLEGYFLQHEISDPKFARCIMKLRKDNTVISEKSTSGVKMHHGIYIDIFPIDYVSDNYPKRLERRAKAIRRLMTLRTIKSGYNGNYKKIKNLIRLGIFWLPASSIDRKIFKLCTLENSGTRDYAILYLHNYNWDRQIHKSEVFGEGTECLFENHKFCAPQNINAFLTTVFGEDYMSEPPKSKRKNPHSYTFVKFN